MTNINSNNIDGTYPIAGIDNDSQGFRDNFTNIKNNFAYAASELTDLQTNVLLKSPLSGTDLNNDMRNALIMNAQCKGFSETAKDLGPITSSVSINFRDGSFQRIQTAGDVAISFTGWPASGFYGKLRLWVQVADILHTVTLPLEASIGVANIAGISNRTITFPSVGTYIFEFSTYDGGSTVVVEDLLRNYAIFTSAMSITGTLAVSDTLSVGGYEVLPTQTYTVVGTSSTFADYPATYQACFIDYVYTNTTGISTGTLAIANNGGLATVTDTNAQVGVPGITFAASVTGGAVSVNQNSVGSGTIKFSMRRM